MLPQALPGRGCHLDAQRHVRIGPLAARAFVTVTSACYARQKVAQTNEDTCGVNTLSPRIFIGLFQLSDPNGRTTAIPNALALATRSHQTVLLAADSSVQWKRIILTTEATLRIRQYR